MNLAEIIGREDDRTAGDEDSWEVNYRATRVADLEVIDGRLVITEGCDGYFYVELDRSETQRLIDWLQKVKSELTDEEVLR